MNKIVEILNIEVCMIDKLISDLTELRKTYKELYDASNRMTGDLSLKFKLEDLLLVNDEIKRELIAIIASRDASQESFIKKLEEIYTEELQNTRDTKNTFEKM